MWNESNNTKIAFNQEKKLILPFCFQWCLMDRKKQLMRVIKYECECIKTHVMSSIIQKFHSMKTTALILLLLIMFGWIDKTMMESDELWMRVDQKYEMSRIVQKLWYGYGKFGGIWF